jgi:hypothetical protein
MTAMLDESVTVGLSLFKEPSIVEETPRSLYQSRRFEIQAPTAAEKDALSLGFHDLDMTRLQIEDRAVIARRESISLDQRRDDAQQEILRTPSRADAAVHDKTELLARRYVAGELSREDEARLEIATLRVRNLIPRILPEDLENLALFVETATSELKSISDRDADRRKRLGIE